MTPWTASPCLLGRPDFARQVGAEIFALDAEQRVGDLLRCLSGPGEGLALRRLTLLERAGTGQALGARLS
ncbi:MAG: hypothetical protein M0Z82_09745 [Actinomycetota bacterium]|nr:hypothetical protein [Actinomycetota bacterium]